MKKSIIALMGLFMLVACSEDSYQEAEKLNETGGVENTGPQKSVKTIDNAISYSSPYQFMSGFVPQYKIYNGTSSLTIEFTAHVGLAYYDGTGAPNYFGTPLNTTLYPNLYNPAPGMKYGNMIETDPIILNPMNVRYAKYGTLPVFVNPVPWGGGTNFNFSFARSRATVSEVNMLDSYGKIYYYSYIIRNGATIITSGNLNTGFTPDIGSFATLPSNWQAIGNDMLFGRELLSENGSLEIVTTENTIAGDFPSQITFNDGVQDYNLFAYSEQQNVHLFLTPAP